MSPTQTPPATLVVPNSNTSPLYRYNSLSHVSPDPFEVPAHAVPYIHEYEGGGGDGGGGEGGGGEGGGGDGGGGGEGGGEGGGLGGGLGGG